MMSLTCFIVACILIDNLECRAMIPELLSLPVITFETRSTNYTETLARAKIFLIEFNRKAEKFQIDSGEANWSYETDLTDEHLQETIEVGEEVSSFYLQSSINATKIKALDLPSYSSRQISLIKRSSDSSEKSLRVDIKNSIGQMTKIYGAAKVQRHDNKNNVTTNLTSADLSKIFKSSREIKELNWAWKSWRDNVGPPTKHHFSSLIDLLNIGAREHGWIDYGDYLRSDYEMSDVELSLDDVWTQIEPLYKELHAYVRYKLSNIYNITKDGCIPASILGDIFAQDWENIFDLVKPSEKFKTFDVTDELKAQNYTVKRMFKLAESFFTSIGLDSMPKTFWNMSVLEKPSNGKEMICHASAWDISKDDVRIKMCTEINQKDLSTVHHEMGHIEYFLAYKNQPTIFRAGANPGFHEAIGDTISLSVETPSYLKKVGLMKKSKLQDDDQISFLLNQALRRIAPIPYNLLVDKWRWRVFEGNITEELYNKAWWDMRVKYQGVEPPVLRPADAFDPASKYHIGANVPYIPYFVSYVLQFQLHKTLCKLAEHKGPLHTCSIYNSTVAGKELRKLLAAGRSQPWPKVLQIFSGENTLKATAILDYFEPLKDWLHSQRKKKKYPLGWKDQSSVEILHTQVEKYEPGQERSGISKTDNNDNDKATLSFNIPPDALKELLKNVPNTKQQNESKNNSVDNQNNIANTTSSNVDTSDYKINPNINNPALIDLSKLLAPGNQLSIKSSESAANDNEGHKGAIDINTESAVPTQNKSLNDGGNDSNNNIKSSETNSKNGEKVTIDKEALFSQLALLLKNENHKNRSSLNGENQAENIISQINSNTPVSNSSEVAATGTTPVNKASNGENQIALVPVSLPSQVFSALQSDHQKNKSSSSLPETSGLTALNTEKISSNTGNLKESLHKQQTNSSVEDSKPYNEDEKATSSAVKPTSISRDELLQLLKTSLLKKNQNNGMLSNMTSVPSDNYNNNNITAGTTGLSTTEDKQSPLKSESKIINEIPSQNKINLPIGLSNTENKQSSLKPESKINNEIPLQNNISLPTTSTAVNNKNEQATNNTSQTVNENGKDVNNEITSSLKKLLGLYNISNPKIVQDKEGERYIQAVESCKRSDGDPRCMTGKTITESGSIPIQKTGIDESKQTVSISPSFLVQKLMEHQKAEESTPDAVVNVQPPITKSSEINNEMSKSSEKTNDTGKKDSDQPKLDANTLLSMLSAALGSNPTKVATSSKRGNDVISDKNNRSEKLFNATTEIGQKNCSRILKRGFSLKYDCNNPLSNYTHVGVKGLSPLSTTELLQKLLGVKPMTDLTRKTVPSAHVQKTSNGFQVNFDLHVKDQIPTQVSGTLKTLSSGRQQHVNIYNTPEGMLMKPKSSVQLLRPSFVPVPQNKDNIELVKIEASKRRFVF